MIIISPFPPHTHNPSKILIPSQNRSFIKRASFFLLLLILAQSFSISSSAARNPHHHEVEETMKVHPLPKKRNNITIQYDGIHHRRQRDPSSHKKLRRLPHIFSRVLELPFRSDADVSIEENPDCFRFVAEADNIGEVRAHTVEIHPGVTKIVVRPNGFLELSSLDDLELDMWRFRLPESTRPELASAVFMDGELIVTVPKGEGGDVEEGGNGEFMGSNNNNARLVLVQ